MTNPTQDRNYYRMLETDELIALSKDINTTELALTLGERLRQTQRKLEQAEERLSRRR
jgi:hypothetical protein